MTNNSNPYASPQAVPAEVPAPLPDLNGRMPTSVKLAVGCLGIMAAINLLLLLVLLFDLDEVGVFFSSIPFAIVTSILIGIAHNNRLAILVGRLVALLCVVFMALVISAVATIVASSLHEGSISRIKIDEADHDPLLNTIAAIAVISMIAPTVLWGMTFLALDRPTAKQYFNLICPACQSHRTKAADFLFKRVKCKACGNIW